MHLSEFTPQLEIQENESSLKKIHEFNKQENSRTLQELAQNGVKKIKSIFQKFNIKESLQSLLDKTPFTSPSGDDPDSIVEDSPTPELADTNSEQAPIILKEFEATDLSTIRADIYTYYKENHTNRIRESIKSKYPEIPADKQEKAVERALRQLAQKPVNNFKAEVATQLKSHGIAEDDFPRFWQWRQKNLPDNIRAQFIYTKTGNELRFDNLITDEVVEKFLDQHISTLSEDFFDNLEEKDKPTQIANIQEDVTTQETLSEVYTSEDIENAFNKELNEFEQYIPTNDTPEVFINTLIEQSNGWVDSQSYENISNIPTSDAIKLLALINSELKPETRQKLFEMEQAISDEAIPFGTFLNNYFTLEENSSKKDISIASDMITKLNKALILSKES